MSQVVTGVEGEGTFNFNSWITQNGLESVKGLLIKHSATTPSTLSNNTKEFQSFMSDPQLFTKPHMIPTILGAVHNITVFKIIVAEEEQQVIDSIHQHIKSLNQIKTHIAKLKQEYPKSIENINEQKLAKIKAAKTKINKIFDNLSHLLNKRRKCMLDQIDAVAIKNKINKNNNDEKDNYNPSIAQTITKTNDFLNQQQTFWDKLTSNNENRLDRKAKIIQMGENIDAKFKQTQNILTKHIDNVSKQIDTNKKVVVDIDFVIKEKTHQQIIKCVNKVGIIINTTFQTDEKKRDGTEEEPDEDEKAVIILTQKLKQESKNTQIMKENTKKAFLRMTTFSKNERYRWLQSEEDDEKKLNSSQCVLVIQQNPIWVRLQNGKIKKNVSNNLLSVSPLIDGDGIGDINQYNQHFFTCFLNAMHDIIQWKVVAASHGLVRAQSLSKQTANACWSGKGALPQWFVIETDIPVLVAQFEWKNRYTYKDIKEFKLQVSNRLDGYNKDNNNWIDVQSFTSLQNNERQSFPVSINKNTQRSRYWRFVVLSTYGGYTGLDCLKLTFTAL